MADHESNNENKPEETADSAQTQENLDTVVVHEDKKIEEKESSTKMNDQDASILEEEKTFVDSENFKEDPPYSEPLPDPYGRAIKYLEKHNIMQLFQSLTSKIVYNKPDDPISYLMTEVSRIKQERDANKQDDGKQAGTN